MLSFFLFFKSQSKMQYLIVTSLVIGISNTVERLQLKTDLIVTWKICGTNMIQDLKSSQAGCSWGLQICVWGVRKLGQRNVCFVENQRLVREWRSRERERLGFADIPSFYSDKQYKMETTLVSIQLPTEPNNHPLKDPSKPLYETSPCDS